MRSLLVGEAASSADQEAIRQAILSVESFEWLIHLRTKHRGPDELLVAAKVAAAAADRVGEISSAVDRAEERIRAAVPGARYVFMESTSIGMRPDRLRRLVHPLEQIGRG